MQQEKVIEEAEKLEMITKDQLKVYGLLKFPKEFMDIGEKTFVYVYENRGVFQAWYLYVKLRMSINKNRDDKSPDRKSNGDGSIPYYTVPVAD